MDTTIRNLDEHTYRALRAHAVIQGRNVGDVLNEAIRGYLARVTEPNAALLCALSNLNPFRKAMKILVAKSTRLSIWHPAAVIVIDHAAIIGVG